jgi:serine/threonine protein kinase
VDKDPDVPGMYRLSNMTGSLRYMAPEVATTGMSYNEACDVYSFTIVLWEMLSLERAYATVGRTKDAFMTKVYKEKIRPPIRHSWTKNVREILTKGWEHDHKQRLTAEQCNEMLRNELISMRHGDDEGLDHTRRRSTFVLEGEDESESEKRGRRNGLAWALPNKAASTTDLMGTRRQATEQLQTLGSMHQSSGRHNHLVQFFELAEA